MDNNQGQVPAEKEEDDTAVMMCLRYTGENKERTARGSVKGRCKECNSLIWIAPTSQRMAASGKYKVLDFICVPCGQEMFKDKEIRTADGAIEELVKNGIPEKEATRLINSINTPEGQKELRELMAENATKTWLGKGLSSN